MWACERDKTRTSRRTRMHWNNKNSAPEALDNATPFHNRRRSDHVGRIAAVRPVLIQSRAVSGDSRQGLELPVGQILQEQRTRQGLSLAVSTLIGSLQSHNGEYGLVGSIHCAPDNGREITAADPTIQDLALLRTGIGRCGAGLGVMVESLGIIFPLFEVVLGVFFLLLLLLVLLLSPADLGLPLSLPPFAARVWPKKKRKIETSKIFFY